MCQFKDKISIIGVGRLGSALANALYKNHYAIVGLIDHSFSLAKNVAKLVGSEIFSNKILDLAESDIIFIAVPDDEINSVVSDLTGCFKRKQVAKFVFHTSGALTSDVFDPLIEFDVVGASLHPIQAFTGEKCDWRKFQNIYFGVEGNPTAIEKASEIIKAIKGHKIYIPKQHKSLYHLACTIASNYMISLMIPVTDLFKQLNFSEHETLEIIHPLLLTTLTNLKCREIEGALTGPISRGDIGTIKKHVGILSKKFPAYKSLYQLHGKILMNLKSVIDKIPDEKYNELITFLNEKGLENGR